MIKKQKINNWIRNKATELNNNSDPKNDHKFS